MNWDDVTGHFEHRVTFSETDALGYVHHRCATVWFEQAREIFFRRFGLSALELYQRGWYLAVRQLNSRLAPGESVRVFPLSNWTELDVWHYIEKEAIPILPLYFARDREVIVRGESLAVVEQSFVPLLPGERLERVRCRMRSLGCSPCTGAIRSDADTVAAIITELIATRNSERQLRVIDHDSDGSMEVKKREGYF